MYSGNGRNLFDSPLLGLIAEGGGIRPDIGRHADDQLIAHFYDFRVGAISHDNKPIFFVEIHHGQNAAAVRAENRRDLVQRDHAAGILHREIGFVAVVQGDHFDFILLPGQP